MKRLRSNYVYEVVMTMLAKIGRWASKTRLRLHLFLLALMLLPITFFAYSVADLLRHEMQAQAISVSTEIARVSTGLIEDHFRQGTSFLESIALNPAFQEAWGKKDLNWIDLELQEASSLHPDFLFVSVYDLDGTMRGIYPSRSDFLNHNFAFRDWYKGFTARQNAYISEVYQTAIPP